MKIIAMLIFTIFTFQSVKAQQVCKDYITDEWPDSRYTVADISGDNVVSDNKTGLMWKQCSEGLSGADCLTGSATTHTWQQALDLASIEDFAGFNDWRVPNLKELRTIAAKNCFTPCINETVFPNTSSSLFWSSSPFANIDDFARIVYFDYGNVGINYRIDAYRVRLVRSNGQ